MLIQAIYMLSNNVSTEEIMISWIAKYYYCLACTGLDNNRGIIKNTNKQAGAELGQAQAGIGLNFDFM